ncbi:MAG: hypothetical protein JNJ49_08525 [Bdellovibrionaceae bacterium]|nr:hypothetical protein [Pseudobdellovibrionaceae bacterium]
MDKSFTPVRFFLIARNPQNAVHFGFFFTENKQDVAERFIEFCKATEYPPGIHGHIIELVLTTCGGSLFAIEAQTITTLIQLAPSIGLLTGDDAVIRYLTKPRQF